MEDFSESPIPDALAQLCTEPIDSTTNEAACFAPGDIVPNISFQTENSLGPGCPACMILHGPDTLFGNSTPLLATIPPDNLEITFPGKKVHFVGMQLYYGLLTIYGPNDTLLGTSFHLPTAPAHAFWGVESFKPISRITINGAPFLTEITFGGKFPWTMYRPATGGADTSVP